MPFALFSYHTTNLGDEIQSIAARQFLPSVDALIDRDRPDKLPDGAPESCRIVFNGWHTHGPEYWPPSPRLIPLLISMHVTNEVYPANAGGLRPADALLTGANLAYLRAHAPVGARDLWTMERLREKGVDAYFSGCLTLTLGTGEQRRRRDYVCATDLWPKLMERLRKHTRGRIVAVTHAESSAASFDERMRRAARLLSIYAHAKCVVTSRLHCALPCLALGTPVLLLTVARDAYRFSGLDGLLRHCAPHAFPKAAGFDLADPPPNGNAYLAYRDKLVAAVNAFVGAGTVGQLHPFMPEEDVEPPIAIEEARAESERRIAAERRSQAGARFDGPDSPDTLGSISKRGGSS
jgi:hypothetical protein